MKCPLCPTTLVELKIDSKVYQRGLNYKCIKCKLGGIE